MNSEIYKSADTLIRNKKLSHAILIDSGSEAEREEFASYLAKAFVCENELPCNLCSNCKKISNGIHPDIQVIDPFDRGKKTFIVEWVREIRTDAFILPNEARCKVYILKHSNLMNQNAQNALLKILEEPPSHARFILICDSRAAMLETIMSRVTPFNLGADSSILNDDISQKAAELAEKLARALADVTELEFMRLSSAFEKNKELLAPTLSYLQLIFRDAVALSTGSKLTISNHTDTATLLTSKLPIKTLISLVENTEHFLDCINKNANKNLLTTRLCSVLRNTAYGC